MSEPRAQLQLTVQQASSVFAMQRMSKHAADEANMLRQFGQVSAAVVLEGMTRTADRETERLIREFQSGLVLAQPGLVVTQ